MRRLLTAALVATLVLGLMPLAVLAANPAASAGPSVTDEDTAVTITLQAVDADGDATTSFTPDTPANGALGSVGTIDCTGGAPNTCTADVLYTPNPDYFGPDSFTFTVTDAAAGVSDPASVDITVNAVNDAPTFTVGADQAVDEDAGAQLVPSWIADGSVGPANELGQTLSYVVAATDTTLFSTQPAIAADGTLTYTPAADAFGTTSISVTAHDDGGTPGVDTSAPQAFDITLNPVNDAPSFTKGADVSVGKASGAFSQPTWATGISAGPSETGQTVTFHVTPTDATLFSAGPDVAADGTLTFTPSGLVGSTSVDVYLTDDGGTGSGGVDTSATQSFTITVLDEVPTADAQTPTATEDTSLPITLTGSDVANDPLTFAVTGGPSHGQLTGTAPDLTYTPAANFFGSDSFTFKVNDGTSDSPDATVSITVTPVNDPVDAKNDARTVTATVTTVLPVLANDSAGPLEDISAVTITSVSKPTKGSATITDGGTTVTYNPTGCTTGTDLFTYTISDGQFTDTASVVVTIARPGQAGLSRNPITDTPTTSLVSGSTIGTTVPLKVGWCGVTYSGTSVRSYRVDQSTNGGSTWSSTLFAATTARSTTRNLVVGTRYRWRVRTVDSAGRTGAFTTSLESRVSRTQDTSSGFTYTGSWHNFSTSNASGGTERYTTAAGASATVTVINVRQFGIVGPRSSTRGSFRVYVDGAWVATVSERASTTQYRRVLYVRSLTSGVGVSHVIRIVAVGGARIDLDALLTLAAP